ncbi:Auxin-responsive protein IAA13 [Morella rubra]|uniref:Auxin-responsive protein n=1 Tax=Morella rubra TaxID=262757 RepID=A0A6A1UGJ7_9ROSI|nr:Auxin-responsive protein IAA13 [Morella rubra]
MELQLGLALPSSPTKVFDLNYYGSEPKEEEISDTWYPSSYQDINQINNKKRSFGRALESGTADRAVPRTLPLLLWNNPPDEEDDSKDLENHSSFTVDENGGDGDGAVGWPPLNSWRHKRLCHDNDPTENGYACGARGPNSTYVKVQMEGVAIARKVDLSLHHSFQTLTETLLDMFGRWLLETGQKNSNEYKLAYQDNEGDWLLTRGVSWRTFIRSVQRLKLLKSSD